MEELMYYPTQIPFMLNDTFRQYINYREQPALDYEGFVICFWEMQPKSEAALSIDNVIVADACIDLVVSYDKRKIGFSGAGKTDFHYEIITPTWFMGARLLPGAFHQLTGLAAGMAMDTFLPIEEVFDDFDSESFFSLSFVCGKEYFKKYVLRKIQQHVPDMFTSLFHTLSEHPPKTADELYSMLHFSPRQCQRLFLKHYGLTPKMVLSIVRFQRCLQILTSSKSSPSDILRVTGYYDQPHFIKDFKRNIGITPLELIRLYRS
jgi:AraC-like DNA-binding protein